MATIRTLFAFAAAAVVGLLAPVSAQKYKLHTFEKRQLARPFFCEGATFGDLNQDRRADLIAGPYWYEGPTFETRHEIYKPRAFNRWVYSDNFFPFVYDFDADGWNDVLVVGFPGKDASWYQNPAGAAGHWKRHKVFDVVDNESPTFQDLTGDGRPELICQTGGRLGWAAPDWKEPAKPWLFHAISKTGIGKRFTHGLGLGDVDGDGRKDIVWKKGWFSQPESLAGDPLWTRHDFAFAGRGGAQMYVYDVDGDGDSDVITSDNAHGYGLFWFEQITKDEKISFARHRIMGDKPEHNRYGVVIGNLHALDLVDMDGDGLKDIVTGNRFWAHSGRDPADRVPPALFWFRLVRAASGKGAHFVPHLIDDNSGVGVQVVAGDVNDDDLPDVVVGNKMGTFVHIHKVEKVTRKKWMKARREAIAAAAKGALYYERKGPIPVGADGKSLNLGFESGDLTDWTATGTAFARMPVKGDTVSTRRKDSSSEHAGGYWVGTYERDKSDKATGTLTSVPFVATHPYASFLVGGGRLKSLRAEIVLADTEKVVFSVSGRNRENMWPRFVDLTKHRDKKIYIRLVDNSKAAWGHINFDDFRFHDEKPAVKKRAEAESSSGKEPGEAAKAMSVPGGFRVDLIASEPELHQPIALTIDERGRLWVAEAHTYPKRQPDGKGRDKILVFEDADADGSFEKRTVFAEQLNLVSGLEVGFGGVWVGAAPYLLFIPDKDGDLVPDAAPVKLLDGFGYEDTHETLNAFIWGPDGWLYGCHGIFTHSKVGKPGTTEESRVPLNAGVWRYHPTRHDFEVFAWGSSNPWGVDFDDNGQAFITACVIPHLYHVIQGARYHRQSNKHFNRYVFADIKTIADHLHYLGSRGDAGNGVSDSVGGGHAHCGAMIYAGDSFPDAYRGRIFFSNIHGNRINTDHLLPSGSGFIGSHGADFLVANDRWFRGVNLKYGPSGNVYLIDWYDQRACHSKVPKLWDRSNGRLYRVSYGEPGVVRVDLAEKSSAELVALHLHKNKWYVRMARRLLQERGPDPKVHLALEAMLTSNPDPATKLSALWTLHATGGLRHEMAMEHLDSPLPYLRGWAVQLLLEDRQAGPDLVAKLARMAKDDDSPVARLYLASALQRLPLADRWAIAEELVARAGDRTDHNLPLMYWYGIEPLVMTDPARALRLAQATPIPLISRFIVRRMATDQKPHLAPLVAALTKSDEAQQEMILGEMLTALEKHGPIKRPPGWDEVAKALARSDKELIRDRALNLAAVFGVTAALRPLRECLTDRKLEKRRRAQALKSLLLVKDGGTLPLLRGLLDDLQMAGPAIRGLAKFDDPKTAALLIDRYLQMRHSDQKDTVSTLTARASWAKAMLASIAAKKIPATVLDSATTRRQIAGLKDEGLDKLMQVAWGHSSTRSEDKQKLIKAWQKKLPGELIDSADLSNGRAVFARTCMKCHKLFGLGREVGPDLTGSNRGNLNYILSNILDPSGEVAKDYLSTVLSTKDGRMITGLLVDDNDRSVTLKTENEEVVVARADINIDEDGKPELWTSTTSMMPEGQLDGMKFDDVRDMIAYLASDEQVPMTATAENLATFFTGEDLTGWTADPSVWRVENGEIVGRAEKGLKKNNFASSHLLLGDFRLTLEVKLVEDRGNSGIQFRSETLVNGAMKGYQADIGVGWWGKLYEEHGRGLIWKKPGDALVKKGEWNTYEILAVGGRVQTAINGALCVDLVDKSGAHRGVIGLQLHSGGPTEVRFRNLKLELAPTFVLKTVE